MWLDLVVAMGSEEERVLENQLELQLQEQRDSLSAIDQALLSDPTDPELLAVQLSLSLSLSLFNKQNLNFFNNPFKFVALFDFPFLSRVRN